MLKDKVMTFSLGVSFVISGIVAVQMGYFTKRMFPMPCALPFHPTIEDQIYNFLSTQAPTIIGGVGALFIYLGFYYLVLTLYLFKEKRG